MENTNKYVGVDLDSTLAFYDYLLDKDRPSTYIGVPIPKMVEKVKRWISEGKKVKLFTARAHHLDSKVKGAIDEWCLEHIGQKLEITNEKTHETEYIYDNIAKEVVDNTGELKEVRLLMEISEILKYQFDKNKESNDKLGNYDIIEKIKMMANLLNR